MDLIYEDREALQQVQERYTQGYTQFKNTLHISAVYEEGLSQVKVKIIFLFTYTIILKYDDRTFFLNTQHQNHGFIP